jgi:hypothetical protein
MKSIEVKFSEACEALKKANKFDKFREACPIGSTIEAQLNCAEAVLSGKVQEAEAAKRYVVKHNGASDNGHLFTESAGMELSADEVTALNNIEAQIKSTMILSRISEADARRVLGLPPVEIVKLGRHAVADYSAARSLGFSEADAIVMIKQSKMGRQAQMYSETA